MKRRLNVARLTQPCCGELIAKNHEDITAAMTK